ncbi:tetratricopeptide repeat protein [bacterium]|nr:tetratricopeptide repeat protein [bacterium]
MRRSLFSSCILLILISCSHLKEADRAYQDRDFDRTIALCRTAVVKDSMDTDAWLLLHNAWLHTDSVRLSLQKMSCFRSISSFSPGQSHDITDLYLKHADRAGSVEKSISLLMEAEQFDSSNIQLLDTLSVLLSGQGRYSESKIRLDRLIDLARDPLPYMNRLNAIENRQSYAKSEYEKGLKAMKTGKTREAEEHLKKAALTDPHFAEAVYEYGMLAGARLYKAGDQESLQESVQVLRNAVRVMPDDIEAHYLLAKSCERKGQSALGEAIEHYQTVIDIAPGCRYAKTCKKKIQTLEKRKAFWEKGK